MNKKHKHSITNVSIFRVVSFNVFWKFSWLGNSAWDFWGLNFGPGIFLGFVWNPRDFLGFWFLLPFDHPRHLKSGVPPWVLPHPDDHAPPTLDCSQSPIFSWDRLDIPRLSATAILIFKYTEGAGVWDYRSGGGGGGCARSRRSDEKIEDCEQQSTPTYKITPGFKPSILNVQSCCVYFV